MMSLLLSSKEKYGEVEYRINVLVIFYFMHNLMLSGHPSERVNLSEMLSTGKRIVLTEM